MTALPKPSGFAGAWFTDEDTRAAYSEGAGPYRIVPAAVAVPEHRDDLQTLVRHAQHESLSLTPRGAGSGMPGGNVGPGVLVDMGRFNRPLRVSANRTANAPAAVTINQINEAAAQLQLRFPPNPSSSAFCTIGGAVSTNAAGPNATRYGSVRPWIQGLELVTADGESCWLGRSTAERPRRKPGAGQATTLEAVAGALGRFDDHARGLIHEATSSIVASNPNTAKNSAGYGVAEYLQSGDVIDLIIGSEGTLGFVTRVETRLDTPPSAAGTVLFGLPDASSLQSVVEAITPLRPSAAEWLDKTFLEASEADLPGAAQGVLIAEFERVQAATLRGVIGDAVRLTAEVVRFAHTAFDAEERARLWSVRRAASATLASLAPSLRTVQVIEDGCVPLRHLTDYVDGVRRASDETGIPVVMFGHAADAHIHVNALVDSADEPMIQRLPDLQERVVQLLLDLGGTAAGEHGDGRLRAPHLNRFYPADVLRAFHAIKDAFDPQGIMNPGVILPPSPTLADNLKFGANAAPIPDYIADRLREVEQGREWARPKHRLVS